MPEETAKPDRESSSRNRRVTISKEGPTVKIQPPAKLVVFFFEGKSGKPVDMSTLKVVGKKWGFSNNLTERLKPFIVGQKIDAANVEIPSGKFHLEVSIADTSGMKTVANYICGGSLIRVAS